jgi:hypothetical protein
MSGYPLKNPTDASKFRQQYLATLALQAKNDDYNLQANKIFNKTGQTPSQMTDTRTTEEKRADIARLKIEVRKELQQSSLADGIQAEAIVGALDDDELIYLANNITEIIKTLQPKNKLGILSAPFLDFLRKSIEKQTETDGVEFGLQEKTGKDIILGLRQIEQSVSPAVFAELRRQIEEDAQFLNTSLYRSLRQNIDDLARIIPSRDFLTSLNQIQDSITRATIQSQMSNALEPLPTSEQVIAILRKLRTATAQRDDDAINRLGTELNALIAQDRATKTQMNEVYKAVQEEVQGVVNPFDNAGGATAAQTPVGKTPAQPSPQSATAASALPQSATDLSPSQISQLKDEFRPTADIESLSKADIYAYFTKIRKILNTKNDDLGIPQGSQSKKQELLDALPDMNDRIERIVFRKSVPQKAPPSVAFAPAPALIPVLKIKKPKKANAQSAAQQQAFAAAAAAAGGKQAGGSQPATPIGGVGIKRMKGCGLSRKPIKINTEEGIKPQDEYVSLGRYFINKPKLNKNIVSVRTKTGHSAKIPVRRVSNNLSSVVKNILGGGMPTTEDLDKLTDEEKNYLHKLSKQSNIIDRLKIPTPNKNQLDKDINEFEIMRGQIMNGNDNTAYIKKFKLLIVKLINQDVLPKAQGQDILMEMTTLGY